jgi:hypothetical protein
MWAHLKAQSPWSPAPVAYSLIWPKSHISNIRHDGTLSFRNFIMKVMNVQNSQFWAFFGLRPWTGLSPKNYKIGHDGILSIENFILMIKNQILLFQLPGNWPTTKKCAPYFRDNMEFPIYYFLYLWPKKLLSFRFVKNVILNFQISKINRKFRVATEIGSTFFGCSSVGKKRNY